MDEREELLANIAEVKQIRDDIQEHIMWTEEWTATTGHSLKSLDLEDLVAQIEPLILVAKWALDGLEMQIAGKDLMGLAGPFSRLASLAIRNVLKVYEEGESRCDEEEIWDEGAAIRLAKTIRSGQETLRSLVERHETLVVRFETLVKSLRGGSLGAKKKKVPSKLEIQFFVATIRENIPEAWDALRRANRGDYVSAMAWVESGIMIVQLYDPDNEALPDLTKELNAITRAQALQEPSRFRKLPETDP